MPGFVESVNAGPVRDVPWGKVRRSGIDKRPEDGAAEVGPTGLAGDGIGDLQHHGGLDQAVHAYAAEDLATWSAELGRPLRAGAFGENLTTRGIDVQAVRMGERWAVGTTLLELSGVRIPCSVFQGFVGEPQWVRRFIERGLTGPYLRVLETGRLRAGDAIEVVHRPDHDLTVGHVFRALTTQRELMPTLVGVPGLSADVTKRIEAWSVPGRGDRSVG